ncbi:hypothetical protein [uncultured Microbacterium sp.]|uniref:hypothetical protein n=1 Tax=uncultured Microbacterium sp. TaxID=191216 RepID=UPI0025CE5EFA|nr:hypothetical protein [uncultured Microbacterium sp.]
MRRLPKRLMPHRDLVSYRPKTGEGAYGPVYGPVVVAKRAAIDDKRRLVRTPQGRELVAAARVALDPEHLMPEGSLVTIWRGRPNERERTVVFIETADFDGLPQFVQVTLE